MRVKPHVELLRHTYNPEEIVAMAARLCYSKLTVEKLQEKITSAQQDKFIERLAKMGHESAFEHISFTFAVEGVSRALLAQITRHRIASFSVQSQRYVGYDAGLNFIIPPRIEALGPEAVNKYETQMQKMYEWYLEWKEALGNCGEAANEDARFVLPNATETRFIFTMNYRELKHFLGLRMCNRAQWEIRELANQVRELCYNISPVLFERVGPNCLCGPCPEGEKSCGQAAEIRQRLLHRSNTDE